ncbi:MAG TPA: 4-aminobutyrate--2-oxoglutarate transaminase, partial [Erwinia persicina]|nr:4-aminobutyrate--2-oxoglutarate transaminase [Erwinia persicina]
MSNSETEQRRLNATPRGVSVMCDFYAVKAENATLWDHQGREYIDFTAGIAVLNTGHRHPKVMAAVRDQLASFTHTAFQVIPYENYIALAEALNARVPIDGPCKTTFFTSGA